MVLGAALGLAALFLYLGTQYSSTTGASFTILFGSMFVITSSTDAGPDRRPRCSRWARWWCWPGCCC